MKPEAELQRPSMRILIAGASGFIGHRLACGLIEAGHEVLPCGRDAKRLKRLFPGREVLEADFSRDRAGVWDARLSGIGAVINAIGLFQESRKNSFEDVHVHGPLALFEACAKARIPKVIQISALGPADNAGTAFLKSKAEAGASFQVLASAHGLTGWATVRPSLVIGRGGGSTALFAALAALPRPVGLGPGTWPVQPIHIADLCEGIRRLIETHGVLPGTLDFVGPAPMPVDALTDALRQWLGLPAAPFLRIPEALLRFTLPLASALMQGAVSPQSLTLLERGNTADVAPLRAALSWQPRPLQDALALEPSTQADLWHARLFFLRPLLRLSLAFLWIATSIVSAFVFPIEKSLQMVSGLDTGGALGQALVYAAAAWDGLLGAAILFNIRPAAMGLLQIATILLFTLLATIAVPFAWIEPFGPLTKNVPVIAATLAMIALEARR